MNKYKDFYQNRLSLSSQMLQRAKKVLASHYSVSSWGEIKDAVFIKQTRGSKVIDIDGNEYIDLCMGYGPGILGHQSPEVVEAVQRVMAHGIVHGFGHEYEVRFAELMVDAIPFAELAAFTNSGTEATMHALKIARAYTEKEKIAKFEGCYHGTHGYALVSGRGMTEGPIEAPHSMAMGAGIAQDTVDQVITLSLNQPESFEILRKNKDELAAVIIEPIPTCCPIDFREFLQELRVTCTECGIVLIFDEILSGFRLNYGSVSQVYGIEPDLATFGKVIGGGFPVGAVVGNREFMKPMISTGDIRKDVKRNVFIVGTFNGNPVTSAAGVATLEFLRDNQDIYDQMNSLSRKIREDIEEYADQIGLPFQTIGVGSWFVPYFNKNKVEKPRDLYWAKNSAMYELLKKYMCKNGVLLADLPIVYLSAAHTKEDCELVIKAFRQSFKDMY